MGDDVQIIDLNQPIRILAESATAGKTEVFEEIDITDLVDKLRSEGKRVVVSARRVVVNGHANELHQHRGWTFQFTEHVENEGSVRRDGEAVPFRSHNLIAIPPTVPHCVGTTRGYPLPLYGLYISYEGDKSG